MLKKRHNHISHTPMFNAAAEIHGAPSYSGIKGRVTFRQQPSGVIVTAEINGLPYSDIQCKNRIFGFHIHEGTSCKGDATDPFAEAKGHYNPGGCPHPYHAGDLPSLFGNKGYAYLSVFTDRFTVQEIVGRVVVIHDMPDDFKTQPAGDSGKKIACGKILLV